MNVSGARRLEVRRVRRRASSDDESLLSEFLDRSENVRRYDTTHEYVTIAVRGAPLQRSWLSLGSPLHSPPAAAGGAAVYGICIIRHPHHLH